MSSEPGAGQSDAHQIADVGRPAENRFCWIKGVPSFDTLKQACIDPTRAYIGEDPPSWVTPSQVISEIHISDADWAKTPHIQLNPGFVAIIGARGSGKTALADMIAAGCDAYEESEERPSFLTRAREHLGGASAELKWMDGRNSAPYPLDDPISVAFETYPRARYLSQQFVEKICSIDGMPELIREIERVIFEAHTEAERDGAFDFGELLTLRASQFREAREREESAIAEISDQIGIEQEKHRLVGSLRKQVAEKERLLEQHRKDKESLFPKGPNQYAERLHAVESAAEKVRHNLRYWVNTHAALMTVKGEVSDFRTNIAPNTLRTMKTRHSASGINEAEWRRFLLNYKGDVDGLIEGSTIAAQKNADAWRGIKPTTAVTADGAFVLPDADLKQQPLAVLEAEKDRLQKLASADKEIQNRLTAVSRKIVEEGTALTTLKATLQDYESAWPRAEKLVTEREAGYERVFDSILNEETVLNELYAPLVTHLTAAGGSLAKLSFSVSRIADCEAWARNGEKDLFDLRGGPFRGIGSLAKIAESELRTAWQSGTPADVAAAMKAFRDKYQAALMEEAPVAKSDQPSYRAWTRRFAQWLYSTDHIAITYGIEYDGIDLRKLSPGTRGIVVLMLHLALDRDDVRPLIIDQPEENLDPKSIFDELVPMFEAAKSRRQVIMVTHNANLVVNANADQIIIASTGAHRMDGLPPISYVGGGIEEADIRAQVCEILEGGEAAFKERSRRLRISLA